MAYIIMKSQNIPVRFFYGFYFSLIMTTSSRPPIELLKEVLANLRNPPALDEHPWAKPASGTSSPGEQLIQEVVETFRSTLPPNPPRTGKRLDTRWGVFGILAAQYFAPILRNRPFPASLRDAWDEIDPSILFFVYGKVEGLTENEIKAYRFAGNEPSPSANSTLSDWQRRGLDTLAELMNTRQTLPPVKETVEKKSAGPRKVWRIFAWSAVAVLTVLAAIAGWRAWDLYQQARALEAQIRELETYVSPLPKMEQIPEIAGKVHEVQKNLDALRTQAQPFLWVTPALGWIPEYGGTIRQADLLLELSQSLVGAADSGLTAITPAVETALTQDKPLEILDLVLELQSASPQLLNAQIALAQAQETRSQIDEQVLIPRIKNLLTGRIDPLFNSLSGAFPMEDALSMVRIAPQLLGSGNEGPQTYLILMQNEDELRATGGFLTAAGSAVVLDGKLISIQIESSELVDDPGKPYPIPPWQFEEFMNIHMLLFRDSNWWTNFPTSASWAEYFYSYGKSTSADGIIALDMQTAVRLLEVLGPVRVENVSLPISHENVLDYMRSAEEKRPKGVIGTWDRKQFISRLAKPLLEKILNARGQTWTELAPVLLELLDEKHILLQFDHEEAAAFLERMSWDGAVRIPENSDFLMAVDTNMGYNKSNAIMKLDMQYRADLSDPLAPAGNLAITQVNLSTQANVLCEPYFTNRFIRPPAPRGEIPDPVYNIDECHWGYLRTYLPAGTELRRSTPMEIAAEATMLGETIPARTDDLGSEDIPNAQVFGMLVLTPAGQATTSELEYTLPSTVVTQNEDGSWTYRLKLQKQPGIRSNEVILQLTLPAGARIKKATLPFEAKDGVWTAQFDLRTDMQIEVTFEGE